MPCPKCQGHNLWDDLMWWGCQDCGFMTSTIHNKPSPLDKWNQPDKWKRPLPKKEETPDE